MKKLTQLILPMLLAQAFCLALGLWLHHQFLYSLTEWQMRKGTITPLENAIADSEASLLSRIPAEAVLGNLVFVSPLAFVWILGMQGVVVYMLVSRANLSLSKDHQKRREESLHKSRELINTRDAVIFGLAKLAESRDPETGMHLERIAMYSTRLASALRHDLRFQNQISSHFVQLIGISSALHDIGKVGIEDRILLKPGDLNEEEFARMQEHAKLGGDCIQTIHRRLGSSSFLEMAREIAYYHHEKFDGSGYPHGLAGEEIPLAARIVAIADVYDALSNKRVYKEAISHEQCVQIICEGKGKHFDPEIVNVFVKIERQFKEIRNQFVESEEPPCNAAVERPELQIDIQATEILSSIV